MRGHKLNTVSVAVLNLKHSLTRSVGLVSLMAALSFVFFLGTLFSGGLKSGLINLKDRMGADIMVVPVENDADMEAVLLKGEPSCFYFARSVYEKTKQIEGVKECTFQFFLTSLDAECCDTRVQLIGFDPATDFCIAPWITKAYDESLENGAVIIGSDISIDDEASIKLFDTRYKVAARLDATGTGLDKAVFGTIDTVKGMYARAYEKGQRFLDEADPDNFISTILIKTEEGKDPGEVVKNIRKALGGVKVVESQSMIRNTADNMKRIGVLLYIFEFLFVLTLTVTVYLVFYITLNERKKEMAILRVIGVTKKNLVGILQTEALILAVLGALGGIAAVIVFVFPFRIFLIDRLGMPYLIPGLLKSAVSGLGCVLLTILVSCLSSFLTVIKIGKNDVYATMREGE